MEESATVNKTQVLILMAPSPLRDQLHKSLKRDGFKAYFTESPKDLLEQAEVLRPGAILHDWPTIDPEIAQKLQQRMARKPNLAPLCRLIYAPTLSPELAALAADCSLRRVVSKATPPSGLVTEIGMALASVHQMPELQRLIHEIQNLANYDQKIIDQQVTKAYRYFSHDPVVQLEYANLLFRQKYLKNATTVVEQILAQNPHNVRATNLLGRILSQEGRFAEATALLNAANMLSPYNVDRLVLLGDIFFATAQLPEAQAHYAAARDLSEPDDHRPLAGLAQVHLSEGDINTALEIMNSSLSEDESASLFNNAAVFAARTGRLESSFQLYQSALRLIKSKGLKAKVYFNLALAYDRLGRHQDALTAVNKSLEFQPENDKARRHRKRVEASLQRKAS